MAEPFQRKIAQQARMAAQNVAAGRLPKRSFHSWPVACFAHLVDALSVLGSQALINSHMMTLDSPKFRSYRGQSYGVDIVKLNAFGSRAVGLLPKSVEQYEIFGETVYAPCAGTVVASRSDHPNAIPPQPDRTYIPGNHVLLRCREADVLLAHFSPGSVTLSAGDVVTAGQPLGTVGNSGNSNEPHLHVHAQRPGSKSDPLNADPLPVVFNDAFGESISPRYLVRNARILHRAAKAN